MVSCLPGDDGESKGAHDDPLAIDHLEQRLHGEEDDGDDVDEGDGVEEVDEDEGEKEMWGNDKRKSGP